MRASVLSSSPSFHSFFYRSLASLFFFASSVCPSFLDLFFARCLLWLLVGCTKEKEEEEEKNSLEKKKERKGKRATLHFSTCKSGSRIRQTQTLWLQRRKWTRTRKHEMAIISFLFVVKIRRRLGNVSLRVFSLWFP